MQKLLLFVDKVSTWVGQAFSFLILALTLHVSWEVYSRYVLDAPRAWAFDVMIMMYGTLFMMAGAYTLAKNSHVRGDVIYGFFTSKGYKMNRETFNKAMANVEVDVGFPTDVRPYLLQIAEGLLKEKKISAIPDWSKALRSQFMEKARG